MSITKILSDANLTSQQKLEKVAEIVADVRESYGNAGVDLPDIKVNTAHGYLPFSNLENDSKVEILMNAALGIKAKAIAKVENNPSIVLNRKVQELIATNSFFANAVSSNGFDYI